MMTAVKLQERKANPMDGKMTPAQVARRKFKSTLPRKPQTRVLSPMQALGETFTLLDQFRDLVFAETQRADVARSLYAALVYTIPDTAKLAFTITVPGPGELIGPFCDEVLALNASFLGLLFVQVDPDAKSTEQQAVSFVVPFMSGPDAEARLLFAQKEELSKIQKVMEDF